jgi:ornithine cyclodeaminase/alanine dehydrogenase-like protein (mu-crystallin family)
VAIPFIAPEDVEARLNWRAVAEAIAAGHRLKRAEIGDTFLHRGEDVLLSRSAWIDGMGIVVKSGVVVPGNAARGLPSVNGAALLFDDATGTVRAILDMGLITKWKTAGDSVLGASILARKDARVLVIVGAGVVADTLVEAYAEMFPGLDRILIWNRNAARAATLVASRRDRYPVELAGDLESALGSADIVSAATMSREPVIRGDWVRPGTHVDLIGAFTREMREADDALMRRARIFVDSRATTIHHIGELSDPIARGVIGEADVLGDFYDLCTGAPGRGSEDEITLFKNGGGAHLDLMTAGVIFAAWETGR